MILLIGFTLFTLALFAFALIGKHKALAIIAGSILLFAARTALVSYEAIPQGEDLHICGTIDEVSVSKPGTVVLRNVTVEGDRYYSRLKLSIKTPCSVPALGDRIETICQVKPPNIRFDNYNERLSFLSDGISAKATCEEYEITAHDRLPLKQKLNSSRNYLINRIAFLFPDNAALFQGFLLGEKTGIDEADIDCFRETGTAHLLTLSGFHVGIITALLFLVLPKRFPKLRFILISLFLLFYCAISAFSASIFRASIMCECMLLSDVFERRRDSLSALSLAALIILLVFPYKLYSVGFRLSFAATIGIVLIGSCEAPSARGPVLRKALGALTVSLGASAATVLITAQYFGYFASYSLLSNVTAVPVFSLAITLGAAALIIGSPFPAVGRLIAFIPDKLCSGGMLILNWIKAMPYSLISVIPPSTLSGILMLALMFSISAYVLKPLKTRLRYAFCIFLVFTASLAADIIRA